MFLPFIISVYVFKLPVSSPALLYNTLPILVCNIPVALLVSSLLLGNLAKSDAALSIKNCLALTAPSWSSFWRFLCFSIRAEVVFIPNISA